MDSFQDYKKSTEQINHKNWKEIKAQRRKWKEEKLLSELEKHKKRKTDDDPKNKEKKEEDAITRTVSIALPGSILDNAQSPELRTYLAGQIARAAVVFRVDEVIIFDETGSAENTTSGSYTGVGKKGHANVQLARILQYLECPQYLRKSLFPQHTDLQYAGLLNPLDCPHHMRAEDECNYREGVVLDKPVKEGKGSYVNIGLKKECQVDLQLQTGVRVTVKLKSTQSDKKTLKGKVVPPSVPRQKEDLYWGYSVRLADSLSSVFTESPYDGGYDLMIGTSERGENVDTLKMKDFRHLLIVYGGVQGLEASLEVDTKLDIEDPSLLFDHYLNTCPGQGSRTIRTEEAILITMSALRPHIQRISSTS
ncbi:putative methyltransferase C9orf114 [Lingula anatina]|uniref:28S rRNA (uridine-N(3))-methyltransferase n=1 Tax=Lingula anatina TaxID=7574 RepID=A0A1S3HWX6_LINAN|nr:putative methyltransferase C9orf114 [Lingula anatina]|eukprot:XP_013389564.1 putative methyltransferase C9orf114 [Lingula anatina]